MQAIHIENFQSHKDTTLELHPGVNFIVGESDKGKTAIFRAIRWVCFGQPRGDRFCSTWGGGTLVSVDKVTRVRNKKTSHYKIDGIKGLFKRCGDQVPEEVESVLNISPLNWQSQLDQHYLISSTPGQAAKQMNRIVDLEVIDTSLSYSNRKGNTLSSSIAATEAELEQKQKELEALSHVDVQLDKLRKVEALWNEVRAKKTASRGLHDAIQRLMVLVHRKDRLHEVVQAASFLKKVDTTQTKRVESLR